MASKSKEQELYEAAAANDLNLVKSLVEEGGVDVSKSIVIPGTWGARECYAAIHAAVQQANVEMVKFLLEKGALPEAKFESYDWRGCGQTRTAFQMALDTGNDEIIVAFLNHGADPNTVCISETHSMRTDGRTKWTPLHTAVSKNALTVIHSLINARADLSIPRVAVYHNERGYDRNDSKTALHLACEEGNIQVVNTLLDAAQALPDYINLFFTETKHVDNPNYVEGERDDPREDGYISPVVCKETKGTALHIAIMRANKDLCDLLLSRGAKPDIPYFNGDGPVQLAPL